jgi:hypothetical protein
MWKERSAPVSSDSDKSCLEGRIDLGPEAAQDAICQSSLCNEQASGKAVHPELRLDGATASVQLVLTARYRSSRND